MRKSLLLSFLFLFITVLNAQSNVFDVNAYKQFLSENQNLSTSRLMSTYQAGKFESNLMLYPKSALYLDSAIIKLSLTNDEVSLLSQNGFMVTERFGMPSMNSALDLVYQKDLPVFISTDAIAEAIHASYDNILKKVEYEVLIPKLRDLLSKINSQIPVLAARYSGNAGMTVMLKDVDLYINMGMKLIGQTPAPYYQENNTAITSMLNYVNSYQPAKIQLFSTKERTIDFSQFKPRGHYDDKSHPVFADYFRTMMWLGRIEMMLSAPKAVLQVSIPEADDIQRQTIDAMLINEAVQNANAYPLYSEINKIIEFFVGAQDNITLDNLTDLRKALVIQDVSTLLNPVTYKTFQDTLKTRSYAFQRILSQILMADVTQPDSITPPSAFMLLGQRFVIDSYVTGQVVFDRITYGGKKVRRMLPSSLDILFALGNDAAGQLLQKEVEKYHYAPNLAALRYLLDSYEPEFWKSSLFNYWLNFIKALNPPAERKSLPPFMQTAAFWQEKINTQLVSWAELRHDNILYAKQSYSGGIGCSYPYGYVEPIPGFYKRVKDFSASALEYMNTMTFPDKEVITGYFSGVAGIMDTLASIAQKELDAVPLDAAEIKFLKGVLKSFGEACAVGYSGWYPRLYAPRFFIDSNKEYVVADFHTAPTDETGLPVGWVKHAGTGMINLGVFLAPYTGMGNVAFVGPVTSYYDYLTTNFQRLTDDEWAKMIMGKTLERPGFTNIYLADKNGNKKAAGDNLVLSVDGNNEFDRPVYNISAVSFPNPFNSSTIIKYSVPAGMAGERCQLIVYNVRGQVVKELLNEVLPEGNYLTRWNGRDNNDKPVASGIYFYRLTAGQKMASGKMNLIK